jgi:MinD-like ATPase involved in chromosome partitioning or flagellar assembly
MPLIGIVPEDEGFSQALSEKIPFMISKPNSKSAKEINRLAAKLVGKEYLYKERTILYHVKKFLGL